jgi:hypothetical protein
LAVGAPKAVVSPESLKLYGEIVTGLREAFTAWNMVPVAG